MRTWCINQLKLRPVATQTSLLLRRLLCARRWLVADFKDMLAQQDVAKGALACSCSTQQNNPWGGWKERTNNVVYQTRYLNVTLISATFSW